MTEIFENRNHDIPRSNTKNAALFVLFRVISWLSSSFFGIAAAIVLSGSVSAHPLGNFTVNQYSRIEAGASRISIRQVVDLAEIPTFQESGLIDTDKDGVMSEPELNSYVERITPGYIANLGLYLNNEPLDLKAVKTDAALTAGAGNLQTLKITWDLEAAAAPGGGAQVRFENKNYADRTGWNEIVVGGAGGVNVYNSSAYGSGITDELRSYPQENLSATLSERRAEFSYAAGAIPAGANPLQTRDGRIATAVERDRLAELIAVPEITLPIALFGLLLAFGLGAMHAMSPGHGKTVVGAYLVGSKGTVKHALFLGFTVTITHTIGVFALGLITLFASNYILPERLMPFLNFVSGLLVFFIGISLFKDRLFGALGMEAGRARPFSRARPR